MAKQQRAESSVLGNSENSIVFHIEGLQQLSDNRFELLNVKPINIQEASWGGLKEELLTNPDLQAAGISEQMVDEIFDDAMDALTTALLAKLLARRMIRG